MMKISAKRLLLVSMLAALPSLQGCFPAVVGGAALGVMSLHDRRSTGTQTDDETTEWKARNQIPAQYAETAHVNFTSYNRRLLITGEAPTAEAKASIEASVRKLEGVREIYNELGIGEISSLGSRSTDSYIDSKVKARLVDSKQISANHIKVVTERAITHLMGIVTEREAKIAIQIARTTAGVRKVVNLLEVVSEEEIRRLDAQVQAPRSRPADEPVLPAEIRQ